MADVAKAVGVSKNTVSLALQGSPKVAEPTRKAIVAKADAMGYRPNPTVAHLMAQLRQNRALGYQGTLAMINAHKARDALTRHPSSSSA
jgi:DNA-binding LacI/PurR family transcriptional regulator